MRSIVNNDEQQAAKEWILEVQSMGQILRMYGADHKLYGYRLVNTRTLGLAGEMEIDKNTAYKLIDRVDTIPL